MFAGFPHPYTAEDAAAWVSRASAEDPVENFVIEVGGMFAGAVGLSPRGMGCEGVGVIGYWLTPAYWGKGIATAAVDAIVNYAIENGFRRLVASVYAPNVGSARVLEKNGFVLEGRLREQRVGRNGVIMDELLFGRILRERILDDTSTAGRTR
jgi:ribosomal-protein-alanine N-acetyltransferase